MVHQTLLLTPLDDRVLSNIYYFWFITYVYYIEVVYNLLSRSSLHRCDFPLTWLALRAFASSARDTALPRRSQSTWWSLISTYSSCFHPKSRKEWTNEDDPADKADGIGWGIEPTHKWIELTDIFTNEPTNERAVFVEQLVNRKSSTSTRQSRILDRQLPVSNQQSSLLKTYIGV